MAERKTPERFLVEVVIEGRKLTEREQKALHKWASSLFPGVPEVSVNPLGEFERRTQRFQFSTPRFWARRGTDHALDLDADGEKS